MTTYNNKAVDNNDVVGEAQPLTADLIRKGLRFATGREQYFLTHGPDIERELTDFVPTEKPTKAFNDERYSSCCNIVRVHYFVRGGFVRHRSRASSKHLFSLLPVDGARFLGGQKGVALRLQDARVGVGSNKEADSC
ncbi:uncharacterized protein TNCV_3579601 [Trichonephila clavipes]|nr:uncharacterized protein TNCV_3579601 [Trichonephila clavipes]